MLLICQLHQLYLYINWCINEFAIFHAKPLQHLFNVALYRLIYIQMHKLQCLGGMDAPITRKMLPSLLPFNTSLTCKWNHSRWNLAKVHVIYHVLKCFNPFCKKMAKYFMPKLYWLMCVPKSKF